jgi:hypothetical protein
MIFLVDDNVACHAHDNDVFYNYCGMTMNIQLDSTDIFTMYLVT